MPFPFDVTRFWMMRRFGRWVRTLVFALGAVGVLTLFPGCVFLLVRTAKAVDRRLDPPQQPLTGAAEFADGLRVTARLIPLDGHGRARLFEKAGRADEAFADDVEVARSGADDGDSPRVRKVLLLSLRNGGKEDAKITVEAVETMLGAPAAGPSTVLLAPGQRALIGTIRSSAETKFETLDVTVRVRRGDASEARTLMLKAP